jgi:hypothetical protein
VATWEAVKFSVLAAGTRTVGRSRGITAPRVGELIAKPIACTTTRPMIVQTLPTSSSACTSSPRVATQVTMDAMIRSLRRSIVSATAPPHSPNTINGMRLAGPSRPTHSEDLVRS